MYQDGNANTVDYGIGTVAVPSYDYIYPWYSWPICKCKDKVSTEFTIEGTPEEVANLIRHFACRLKITIQSLGEE